MIKTGILGPQFSGSTLFFMLVISLNSGALASSKQPFLGNENLADADIGALQTTSACVYKRLLWEDKEYPCLIE